MNLWIGYFLIQPGALMPKPKAQFRTTMIAGKRVLARGDGHSAARSIAGRLRELRMQRKMSQGEIEKRTGLLRCYVSRVEGGYTVPSVVTLEKFAAALAVPLHLFFYRGKGSELRSISEAKPARPEPRDAFSEKLRRLIRKMDGRDRDTFLSIVRKLNVLQA
jgi:transcriptional regulator with XRE-family HTH domain